MDTGVMIGLGTGYQGGLVRDVPQRGMEETDATTRFDGTLVPPKRGNEVKLWGKHNIRS